MKHPFFDVLATTRGPVAEVMQRYLGGEVPGISQERNEDVEAFHWQLSADYPRRGGKFLRPTLLILTAEAMGTDPTDTYQTAAALEISQNWLLIHDDVEDRSPLRRGEPALHVTHGDALAINAGDSLHLLMWRILRENAPILGAEKTLAVMAEFDRMLMRTCVGQTAELMWQKRLDFTEEDYFYIIDGKTSYYTIAGGMRLGAIIAEDAPDRLEGHILPQLDAFGTALGRAFQIVDDVLDVSTTDDGKQRGGDIAEGKVTLILAHLLQNANPADLEHIQAVMGRAHGDIPQEDVDSIITLMEEYGSIAHARLRALEFAGEARELFEAMDFLTEHEARTRLAAAIDFVANRTS